MFTNNVRPIARQYARELSFDEIAMVSGGVKKKATAKLTGDVNLGHQQIGSTVKDWEADIEIEF